ncbi:hypothetical protein AB4455_07200 [Vibrio sp. 10N.261.46.E12]|uniref:hypothetical protein n=1 Tax=unclassified Vibrio TaxID=2614977 RepID=UPI00097872C8|nr:MULTISPECIES: hypothetical protein [unclassified Vibrio]OMO36493.1 hypothetical protein BH584_04195 [Vibrio sp. 10N.261.45.E1]PMJ22159.1 hypothetical protein BCU27_17235 [Vibrio sp. 10N.286.45.B6]PML97397.1 hypothetical protein BCT66_20965 [Vibrio sp. 10N.261.49.E11]PMM76529.1 hypothetical protein BCT48_01820 [Vibrio sp. 10N.261.46.F12]PMM82512.1 hypothetical protein BCT46_14265 [Vibrio sp. 10N.261.46.E8]
MSNTLLLDSLRSALESACHISLDGGQTVATIISRDEEQMYIPNNDDSAHGCVDVTYDGFKGVSSISFEEILSSHKLELLKLEKPVEVTLPKFSTELNDTEQVSVPQKLDSVTKEFPYLSMTVGDELDESMSAMHLDDDDCITALMIQNTDENCEKYGNCILVDKDGTTNFYAPVTGDSVRQASLLDCFIFITDEPEAAMSHFVDEIIGTVTKFSKEAAENLKQ